MKNWTAKQNIDIFRDFKLIVIPINVRNLHWTIMFLLPPAKQYVFLDPMHQNGENDSASVHFEARSVFVMSLAFFK